MTRPMSAEQWDAFLEKVESDTQLQENLKEVTTPEAAIAIAKAAGYSITADDIQAEEEDELSLEELISRWSRRSPSLQIRIL